MTVNHTLRNHWKIVSVLRANFRSFVHSRDSLIWHRACLIGLVNAEQKTYPETYLHVHECRSGETWILPIRGNGLLDLRHQIKRWIKQEFCGELKLSGEIMPKLEGDYYGKIMTDGRAPDSVVCWSGGGFYLESTYE